ncbi:MAG: alpha/beta hydrolase [Thermoleophilia bacterium]|nr:alpha/beta hydrolase [Thermoleophilia bacterium]
MRVLLLHAGIADRRMWARQIAALEAAGHRVAAPDLPGFGVEPLVPPTVDYVGFAAGLLDEPGAVVGCSFGGRVALELAAARPDLVARLVLVAPGLASTEWSEESQAGFAAEEELLERGDLDGAARQQAAMWLAPDAAADVRELTEAMTVRSYEQQLPVDGQVRGVWPEVSAETRLAELDVPTLVVVGDADLPELHALAERIAGALPDAKLQTIPAAGHLPSLERPDELNRLLLDFLQ